MPDRSDHDKHQLDISDDEFQREGIRLLRWITDYLSHPEQYRVLPRVSPGEVRSKLPTHPPMEPESVDAIMKDLDAVVVPGLTHWNHPGFFAYFANTASRPGILGELLSAALNPNAMLWKTSPSSVELEEVVIDWVRQMMGLPPEYVGLIHDTASTSSLVALTAAREAMGLKIRQKGMAGRSDLPRLRMYLSEHAHSSIEKAALVLGFGHEGLRKIPTDSAFRMQPEALSSAIENDRTQGWLPCAVVATVGTTSTTSVDPVPAIAEIAGRERIWLHVDAAYAGSAAVVPEMRWLMDGCERADSIVTNPHKWMFVPVDCSILLYRNPEAIRRAFSLVPDYLRSEHEEVRNPMDYGIALGRRFRALKLWMVLRMFGVRGIQERIRRHVHLAQDFKRWVEESDSFELLAPSELSVVCFRHNPRKGKTPSEADQSGLNALNEKLLERVNASGEVFLTSTTVSETLILRVAVGNLFTTSSHVLRVWELLQQEARRLSDE
jgi:aromatic-L-amino-acid decarboxylase